MPNQNQTGPEGQGPTTGRGMGGCRQENSNGESQGCRRGLGPGKGQGRGVAAGGRGVGGRRQGGQGGRGRQ